MHTARKHDATDTSADTSATTVTLHVIDTDHPGHSASARPTVPAPVTELQLLCQVALEPTGSSPARRQRLHDSLRGGDASRNAATLARDPHFWDFLQQINLMAYDGEIDGSRARHFINRVCGVNGRHEFEHCQEAAQRYFSLVEQPFLDWLMAEPAG